MQTAETGQERAGTEKDVGVKGAAGKAGVVVGMVERGAQVCTYTPEGMCEEHGQAQKHWKPRRRWAKGKNGLFGWKREKIPYYVCVPPRPIEDKDVGRTAPTFLILKSGADNKQRGTSKRPTTVGQSK